MQFKFYTDVNCVAVSGVERGTLAITNNIFNSLSVVIYFMHADRRKLRRNFRPGLMMITHPTQHCLTALCDWNSAARLIIPPVCEMTLF